MSWRMDQTSDVETSTGHYSETDLGSVSDLTELDAKMEMMRCRTSFVESFTGDSCPKCEKVHKEYQDHQTYFLYHISRDILWHGILKTLEEKKSYKEKKKKFCQKLVCFAASLRNTNGGAILIHIDGQRQHDAYLGNFDELVETWLERLIDDGKLYHEIFTRRWLSDIKGYEDYHDFVHIDVKKTDGVATVDFHTKISNDVQISNPHSSHIVAILSNNAPKDNISQRENFQSICKEDGSYNKSCHLILKASMPEMDLIHEVNDFVDYIWTQLRLKEVLTALTKVKGGGNFLVGITEKISRSDSYETRKSQTIGFELAVDQQEVIDCLRRKIATETCVLRDNIFQPCGEELVKIKFHTIGRDRVVLDVAISETDGIVFSDREGPETYVIKDNEVRRMDKEIWLERIKRYRMKITPETDADREGNTN